MAAVPDTDASSSKNTILSSEDFSNASFAIEAMVVGMRTSTLVVPLNALAPIEEAPSANAITISFVPANASAGIELTPLGI